MKANPYIDPKKLRDMLSLPIGEGDSLSIMALTLDNAAQNAFIPMVHHSKESSSGHLNVPYFHKKFFEQSSLGSLAKDGLVGLYESATALYNFKGPVDKTTVHLMYSLAYHLLNPDYAKNQQKRVAIERMFEILELGKQLSEEETLTRMPEIVSLAQQRQANAPSR